MRQELVIIGDDVKTRTYNDQTICTVDEFLNSFENASSVITPVLPFNCRLYATRRSRTVFVIEEPAKLRTVYANPVDTDNPEHEVCCKIKTPVIYMVIVFSNLAFENAYILGRSTPIQAPEDMLHLVPLPNIFGGGKLCTGRGMNLDVTENNFIKKVGDVLEHFWTSRFQDDLSYYRDWIPSKIAGVSLNEVEGFRDLSEHCQGSNAVRHLLQWDHVSKDPLFYWEDSMMPAKVSVGDLMSRLAGGSDEL